MVQFHNLTVFSSGEGYMDFLKNMSTITSLFPLFLMSILFIIVTFMLINKENDVNDSIHVASLYTSFLGIVLYIAGVATLSVYIFIPAVIYAITAAIRWYDK